MSGPVGFFIGILIGFAALHLAWYRGRLETLVQRHFEKIRAKLDAKLLD